MKKIIANRGRGKTTNLLEMAIAYAEANPQDNVFFAAASFSSISLIEQKMLDKEWPSNFSIIHHNAVSKVNKHTKNVKIFVDEVDSFLEDFGIIGYSMTLAEVLF